MASPFGAHLGADFAAQRVAHDRVSYQIFGTLPGSRPPPGAPTAAESTETHDAGRLAAGVAEALEACKAACMAHLEPFLEGYIWQREPFQLEVVADEACAAAAGGGGARGTPPHLAGSSSFGDNVEDEWFIVWMLAELTRAFPTLSARVWDNDGEFLLIECAFHLPKWVKPEAVTNRVFLHGGELHVVPPAATAGLGPWARERGKRDDEHTVTVEAALWLVRGGDHSVSAGSTVATLAPAAARRTLSRRLEGYPAEAAKGMHRAFAVLPAQLAHTLRAEPQLISLAVEAFYERDPEGLKAAAKMKWFPPEDMKGVLVSLTRCLYAQLVRQRFAPPRWYPMPSPGNRKQYAGAELGMKIAVGFEMLAAEWARNGHNVLPPQTDSVSEPSASAARDEEGEKREREKEPVGDATWNAFRSSLERNGYFRGEIKGSVAHRALLAAAIAQYKTSAWSERARAVVAAPALRATAALAAVTSAGLRGDDLPAVGPEDADAWMYEVDGEEDPLERELGKRELERRAMMERFEAKAGPGEDDGDGHGEGEEDGMNKGEGERGRKKQPEDTDSDVLAAMAQRLKTFMGERSGHEGVDFKQQQESNEGRAGGDRDEGEDLMDAHKFLAELSAALGMDKGGEIGAGMTMDGVFTDDDDDFSSEDSSDSDDDSEDLDDAGHYVYENDRGGMWGGVSAETAAADVDVKWSDGVRIAPPGARPALGLDIDDDVSGAGEGGFMDEYEKAMRRQLRGTSVGSTFSKAASRADDRGDEKQNEAERASTSAARGRGKSGVLPQSFIGDVDDSDGRGSSDDDDSDVGEDEPLDLDVNLVENMLASYKGQEGLSGPASNLLASMGVSGLSFSNFVDGEDEDEP